MVVVELWLNVIAIVNAKRKKSPMRRYLVMHHTESIYD